MLTVDQIGISCFLPFRLVVPRRRLVLPHSARTPPRATEPSRSRLLSKAIKCPGTFQNALGAFRNAITHITYHLATCALRPSWPCRMAPSVRPDGRPSRGVCKKGSDTGRTAHFRAVGAQRGALTPDVRPVALASIRWPIWPVLDRARPCECHPTIAHVTAAAVGVYWHHPRTEHLRLALCHQWCRTCD